MPDFDSGGALGSSPAIPEFEGVVELSFKKREIGKKSLIRAVRRSGNYPGVVYAHNSPSVPITVDGKMFDLCLSALGKNELSTKVFDITFAGEKFRAVVKDISYDRIKYSVEHIDFMRVKDGDVITLNVPVLCKNTTLCIGVVEGGQIKINSHFVRMSGKLSEIPKFLFVDVKDLHLGSFVRLEDLSLPSSLKLHMEPKRVLVAVSK